jgi:muramoyltetrapeptide carboxypeptidase
MALNAVVKPAALKRGDRIGIVAPASSFDRIAFRRGVETVKKLGYAVTYDRSIYRKYWSMAGSDSERAGQINRMFADPDIKAIFCAKAGYGSMRTIPYLDQKVIRRNPKIFVGYSDITALLGFMQRTFGMVVFYGPVVADEIHDGMNPTTVDYLIRAIGGDEPMGRLTFKGLKRLRPGKARGPLVGGNLSIFTSMIGTPCETDTDGRILFLEDTGESMEAIDNSLTHLRLAGKLDGVEGLLLGTLVDHFDSAGKKYGLSHMIDDHLGKRDIPVLSGFPAGHRRSDELNVTLPLGTMVTLDADVGYVLFHEPGVRRG